MMYTISRMLFKHTQRWLSVKAFKFPEDPRVVHYKFTREIGESDADILDQIIEHTIKLHKHAIIIGVEPSYLLTKDEHGKYAKCIQSSDELFHAYMEGGGEFKPHPGHIFMNLLDGTSSVDKHVHISLRPKLGAHYLTSGKTALHPEIYKSNNMSASIFHSKHTTYSEEIKKMARDIKNFIEGHFTVIPFECSKINIDEIRKNSEAVLTIRLYHLCMSIYKGSTIHDIKDEEVRNEIFKLATIAEKIQNFHGKRMTNADSESLMLAAMACTHAVVKGVFGNSHHFEFIHGPDLDTQAVATYLVMALIGNNKFFNFAEEVGLLNFASAYIKSVNGNKNIPRMS